MANKIEKPTDEQIQAQIDQAIEEAPKHYSLTYQDGVMFALQWVLGICPDAPMD